MKVLHLFGDWKWTGPAEPVLDLCLKLRELGVETTLAAEAPPEGVSTALQLSARERGMDLNTAFTFGRFPWGKHIRAVRDFIDAEKFDLVHVHMTHDHLLGGPAARRSKCRPKILRTNHRAVPMPAHWGTKLLMRRYADGYLTFSRRAMEADRDALGLSRVWTVDPAMHLGRFDPMIEADRGTFGIEGDAFVLGVVARMQRHRRFDVLLRGIRMANVSNLRVLVVGRGTHMEEVAVKPAKELGLEDRVTFTGYIRKRFLNVMAAFDAMLFLVPGSDGTCRAIREGMAMGKPIIGARRGMIPDLVEHEKTGLVIDDTPEKIAAAIERLARKPEEVRQMGQQGRKRALERFDIRQQAERVKGIYEELLGRD